MRSILILLAALMLGFPASVLAQTLVIPKNKYGQLYYCKKGQKQFVTVNGRTYKVCTDAEKEARDVVSIFSIPGIVPRGVPRTGTGFSETPKASDKYVMMKFTPEAYNQIWDNSLSNFHPDYPSSYMQKECKEELKGRCRNVASGLFMGRRMLKLSQENRVIVKVSEGSFELDKDILEIVEVDEMGNPKN